MKFGERLKEVRKQNGLTQVELAEVLGIHSITVSRWEISANQPPIKTLVDIAILFSVSADYLLGLDGMAEKEDSHI